MIIIINKEDATLLRDFIYKELERKKNTAAMNLLPTGITIEKIVTSDWWKSLQDALKVDGKIFTETIKDNIIITENMREEIKQQAIKMYEDIVAGP